MVINNFKQAALYKAYVEVGYKEWDSPASEKLRSTRYFLQKCIMKGNTKLFYITVYIYLLTFENSILYQPEAGFKMQDETNFQVILTQNTSIPAKVEKFYRKIYREMNCLPYYKPRDKEVG